MWGQAHRVGCTQQGEAALSSGSSQPAPHPVSPKPETLPTGPTSGSPRGSFVKKILVDKSWALPLMSGIRAFLSVLLTLSSQLEGFCVRMSGGRARTPMGFTSPRCVCSGRLWLCPQRRLGCAIRFWPGCPAP